MVLPFSIIRMAFPPECNFSQIHQNKATALSSKHIRRLAHSQKHTLLCSCSKCLASHFKTRKLSSSQITQLQYLFLTKSSKDPRNIVLVKDIVLNALTYNVVFHAEHVPGIHNTIVDPLSCLHVDQFWSRSHEVDQFPMPVSDILFLVTTATFR